MKNQFRVCLACGVLGALFLVGVEGGKAAAPPVKLPTATLDDTTTTSPGKSTIVLAGGCFWGVEEVFQHVKGVVDAVSGYSGGSSKTANYDLVSAGTSGHAESVKITYDPAKITLGQIFKVFFSVAHDPTQLNRQGPDVGPQYRSAIFYLDNQQKAIAESYIKQLDEAKVFSGTIATKVSPLQAFYEAEGYHQNYLVNHPNEPYIVYNDMPKLVYLRKLLPELCKQ